MDIIEKMGIGYEAHIPVENEAMKRCRKAAPELLRALIVAMEALEYISEWEIPLATHEIVRSAIENGACKTWEEVKELLL